MYKVVLNAQGRGGLTVNIHRDELDEINKKLQTIQDFHGINPGTGRELFMSMIAVLENQALSGIAPAAKTDEQVPLPENMVTLADLESALFERTKELSDECNAKTQEIEALKDQLRVFEDMEVPETVEIVKYRERELSEYELLMGFSEKQMYVLKLIASNRAKRLRLRQPEDLDEIVRQMVFNRGALFNWHEEYYTGLLKKDIIK